MVYGVSMVIASIVMACVWFSLSSRKERDELYKRLDEMVPGKSAQKQSSIIIRDAGKQKRREFVLIYLFGISAALTWVLYFFSPGKIFSKGVIIFLLVFAMQRIVALQKKRKRLARVGEDLPMMLDLLVVCVEAGMSINSALYRVSEEYRQSPLADEWRQTFHMMNAGMPFEDAFRALAKRVPNSDLQSLVSSIIQADKMGMALGETLRNQSQLLREITRLQTKELIMKVPIKLIFPLALFLMPAIFVILAAPALIQMSQLFGNK